MDVRLREASSADVPSLEIVRRQAIEHGLADEYGHAAVADRVAGEDPDLPEWIESDTHAVTVVESEVTVLAYGVYDREHGRILGIYTAPSYEREGWGTRLLERFETLARKAGSDAITAEVPRNAVAFFETAGFERGAEIERDGLRLRRMRKPL